MKTERLQKVDAFIMFDLDDADVSVGPTRLGPRILVDGARWLARSMTYQFASFGLKIGGASAGINAPAETRDQSVSAFVAETEPFVRDRRFLTEPGRGVTLEDFSSLQQVDPRSPLYWTEGRSLTALGLVHSAETAIGTLDGCTVAIEGFDALGVVLADEVAARGGRVVALGTSRGTATDDGGFGSGALRAAWDDHGVALVGHLDPAASPPDAITGAAVDVLFAGSRHGIVDHVVAAGVRAKALVPSGPIPVTAKGLAVLRRTGVIVLPDFVTLAGPLFAAFPPEGRRPEELRETVSRRIPEALEDVLGHEEGPLLGACARAEAFLTTWQSTLPFGRPLA